MIPSFIRSSSPLPGLRDLARQPLRPARRVEGQHVAPELVAEPGLLPLGVLPGRDRDRLGDVVARALAVQVLDRLPRAAREYVDFIEGELGAEVALVSTGPRREETIVRVLPALRRLTSGRLPA